MHHFIASQLRTAHLLARGCPEAAAGHGPAMAVGTASNRMRRLRECCFL
jgi:hypothetical protein